MTSELLFLLTVTLLKAQLALSVAIVLVFCLRTTARRLIGAEAAYGLWALAPMAAAVSFFPTRTDVFSGAAAKYSLAFHDPAMEAFWRWVSPLLLTGWFAGAAVFVALLVVSEQRFRRLIEKGVAGPAIVGVGWMRLVTPDNYDTQFTAAERALVLRHERAHILRDDPLANLLIVVIQAISWFNPLVYQAAVAARIDQELACDQAVIRHGPDCRRAYAATLLKAQLVGRVSPLACAWAPWARHPLELRLRMLARRPRGLIGPRLGSVALAIAVLTVATGVWALEPQCVLSRALSGKAHGIERASDAVAAADPQRPPFLLTFKLDPSLAL